MFALYLVRGLAMHLGGYWVKHLVWRVIERNRKDMSGWLVLLIAGWAVNRGLLLWVADIFHREVVGKSVQLIQWIGDEDDCHALKGLYAVSKTVVKRKAN
jgi:hypothetical protein